MTDTPNTPHETALVQELTKAETAYIKAQTILALQQAQMIEEGRAARAAFERASTCHECQHRSGGADLIVLGAVLLFGFGIYQIAKGQ